ncbi:hypothetical protein KFU94_37410 [Chloroflexi bacterium TSY]|nr:hypothetical protein [Chloroflexi bacterium TSY]
MVAKTAMSPQPREEHFKNLIAKTEQSLIKFTKHLVSVSDVLEYPDHEDVYSLGLMKAWKTYFKPGAFQNYYHQSEQKDLALMKSILRSVVRDLERRKNRERLVLRTVDLDGSAGNDEDDSYTLHDIIASIESIEVAELYADVLNELYKVARKPNKRQVLEYILGNMTREELDESIDDNYIRVNEHRFKKLVFRLLGID